MGLVLSGEINASVNRQPSKPVDFGNRKNIILSPTWGRIRMKCCGISQLGKNLPR